MNLRDGKILKQLTYFWSITTMFFLVADFFDHIRFGFLFNTLSSIYIGVLSLYAGTKEFNRWHDMDSNRRHPGEWFVIIWTILIFILFISSMFLNDQTHRLSSGATTVYISVMTIFALTRQSKFMYKLRAVSK